MPTIKHATEEQIAAATKQAGDRAKKLADRLTFMCEECGKGFKDDFVVIPSDAVLICYDCYRWFKTHQVCKRSL